VITAQRGQFLAGPYRIENVDVDVAVQLSNKSPSGTYRGPGRYEADFIRERLFDLAAGELGIDRVAFRRRNLVPEDEMPYPVPNIAPAPNPTQLDSGAYALVLDRCLAEAKWDEKQSLQGKLIDGRYHGLALGCFIEGGAAGPKENARIVVEADGALSVYVGSSAVGQGVETVLGQIAADAMDVSFDRVRVLHGSTSYVQEGWGSYASRSTVMEAPRSRGGGGVEGQASRGGGQALQLRAGGGYDRPRQGDGAGLPGVDPRGSRAAGPRGREQLPESPAHLHLRHAHRPRRGGCAARPCPARGLCRCGRCRSHHQSAHLARAGCRRHRPGAGRHASRGSGLRSGRTAPHRYVRRLPDAVGHGLPADHGDLARAPAVAFNPLGAKGAGEGGIIPVGGVIANAVAAALRSFNVEPNELPLSPPMVWRLLANARRAGKVFPPHASRGEVPA
jgi:carbon-monoxide dehydrogenase large subunit